MNFFFLFRGYIALFLGFFSTIKLASYSLDTLKEDDLECTEQLVSYFSLVTFGCYCEGVFYCFAACVPLDDWLLYQKRMLERTLWIILATAIAFVSYYSYKSCVDPSMTFFKIFVTLVLNKIIVMNVIDIRLWIDNPINTQQLFF